MAEIEVSKIDEHRYRVEVREGQSRTLHEVTAAERDVHNYGGDVEPEQLIEASFRFLLERESKESILRHFKLPVIERYFPDYPARIREYLP